jgi:hypothetical protein
MLAAMQVSADVGIFLVPSGRVYGVTEGGTAGIEHGHHAIHRW